MRAPLFIICLSSGILFSGCTVGPNYGKPKVAVEPEFGEVAGMVSTNVPVGVWWKSFQDPELEKLIDEALRDNLDLQIAIARVRESRFQRNMTAADLFPNVDADAGYNQARGSKNVQLPLGGGSGASGSSSSGSSSTGPSPRENTTENSGGNSSSSRSSGNDAAFDNQLSPFGKGGLPGAETDLYQVGFDATWEIDVFGAKRRRVEAATAETQAAREAENSFKVTLAAEVAQNYFQLRGAQLRLSVARTNLAVQKQILELTTSRANSGLTSQTDVTRAAAQVATTSATIAPLDATMRQKIHALSILLARQPNDLSAVLLDAKPLSPSPPEIPIGLPSELLERRPDIRRAEQQIVAANARIGNAKADLFPKFALIGSAGLDSTTVENLFDWESRYFLISPTVTWRIFDAGRIVSNINLQRATKDEMVLQYRSTILTALQEVEDALVNYATEQSRQRDLADALEQNKLSSELALQRYTKGLVSFLEVLDSERSVLLAQDALVQSHQTVATDLVALYKALGGGWK